MSPNHNSMESKAAIQQLSFLHNVEPQVKMDGMPSCQGQVSTRKRRRGVIEKRRRDRINNSLSELRKIVPACFEKQGSGKLEKAEILQMTVEHLKLVQSKGLGGFTDPTARTAIAMEYRSLGFRECASEVSRYLASIEGLEIQDPMRTRLMTHLQCCQAQRDSAVVAQRHGNWHPPTSNQNAAGSSGSFQDIHHPQPPPFLQPPQCNMSEPRPSQATIVDPRYHQNPAAYGPHLGYPPGKPYRPWGTELGSF